MDARIDAAVVEYAEVMMDWQYANMRDLEGRISDAKAGGFPPLPKWRGEWKRKKEEDPTFHPSLNTHPEAKGNFTW